MAHPGALRTALTGVRVQPSRLGAATALLALVGAATGLRTRVLDVGYWIDEGLAVGIAAHPIADIPGLLAQDGSPPLYYLLLSVWMDVAGSGEAATRLLSLAAALATVPASLWAGRALFGPRAGWYSAAMAATLPLLTIHAQETRMYALVALLSVLVCATYALAFVDGRPQALVAFVALCAALLYTHNWGAYLLLGLALALPVVARRRGFRAVLREAALAAGLVAAMYAPWLPTLLYQASHTGAPWSTVPDAGGLVNPVTVPLGEGVAALIALAGAGFGFVRLSRRRPPRERTAAVALTVALLAGGVCAWLGAQLEPGWADRYMIVFIGPIALVLGTGLAAAGRPGLVAIAAALVLWGSDEAPPSKSNVRDVAAATADMVQGGDMVVVTQPEQVPVVSHYMPAGLRWATAMGPQEDPRTFDWREALARLRAAEPDRMLDTMLAGAAGHLVLITPAALDPAPQLPPWLDLVARRTRQWSQLAERHPRLRRIVHLRRGDGSGTDVEALVYRIAPAQS